MGFWSSFFGAGATHVYNEMKKEEKETQKWNDLFHEMMECESTFNDYLKSVGIIDSYCADVEYVNNGNIAPLKREIENLRKKVNNYISLGGLGVCVRNLGSLDDDIDKVKYLKKVGQLERQVEFAYDDMCTVQDKIEAEQEEIEYQQERLREERQEQRRQEINNIVGTDINSLSGVEFELICQQLVENMGFETETTKASGDGGIDLIAYNHQPLLSGKYIIQCKRYSGSVGEPIIRDLYGVVMSERANKGILMTTGVFTKSAIEFAEGKPIELIDGVAMHSLLKQYGMIEKSFEEQKSDYIEEAAQKLEDILSMLNDDEYDPYDFTQEEKQILKEKEQLFEKNRVKENEKLLATEEVKIFKNSLTIAENRDKYKVSSEILNHYIEYINCIFQIVTDQTSLSECDMNGNIKNTFKGTIFYFINAKENIATIGDIVNRNIPISLDFSCQQGAKFISFSMDVSSDFVISSDTLNKSITISNKKSKINLSLPFGDDYRNAYDYLYILKNTNNAMR